MDQKRIDKIKREFKYFELDIKCGILILLIDIADIFDSFKLFITDYIINVK
jgi:hypothetical protein